MSTRTTLGVIAILFVLASILPSFAQAQVGDEIQREPQTTEPGGYTFVPLTNLPGINEAANSESLPTFFNSLYKLCIGAAAVIAVLQIMRAGMYFMFNKGSVAHNEQAKGLISNSILGLLLVLSPAIIFGVINPDILDLRLDISGLELGSTTVDPIVPISGQGAPVPGQPETEAIISTEYEWRIKWVNERNGYVGPPYGQRKPTQALCQSTLEAEITRVNREQPNWNIDGNYVGCDCRQPRSAFQQCRQ